MLVKQQFFVLMINSDRLHLGEIIQTAPSKYNQIAIGFNVETIQFKNLKFQVWDLGGQTAIRPYWRSYYAHTNSIIYVIDSSDRERLETTKQEFMMMLEV